MRPFIHTSISPYNPLNPFYILHRYLFNMVKSTKNRPSLYTYFIQQKSIQPSIHPPIHLYIFVPPPSIYLSIYSSTHLSINPSNHLSIHSPTIYPSIHIFYHPPTHHPSTHLFTQSSTHLPIHPYISTH